MTQQQLNEAMSRPLKTLALNLDPQEALKYNPDLQELHEAICGQARFFATGHTDPKLGEVLANLFFSGNEMMPGIYEPMIDVIRDIHRVHGTEKGRRLVIERGMQIVAQYYGTLYDRLTQEGIPVS